jgi:putative copper export protein
MSPSYYISVWLHIIGATFWIGGMLFLPLVLLPGIKDHPDRKKLLLATGLKFRYFGYIALALMLVTGLLNIYYRGLSFSWTFFFESKYGSLVSLKILLFITMIILSIFHDLIFGRKAIEEQLMDDPALKLITRWTGRLLLLISIVMAYIGVVLSRGG